MAMRITLIIHALTSGGAERVLTVMANYWAVKGEQVTILTFADGSANSFYALDERIEHRPLDLKVDSMNVWNGTINH